MGQPWLIILVLEVFFYLKKEDKNKIFVFMFLSAMVYTHPQNKSRAYFVVCLSQGANDILFL